jgi:probable HAF family extracellular repeat protein
MVLRRTSFAVALAVALTGLAVPTSAQAAAPRYDLEYLTAANGSANAVNDRGDVVGTSLVGAHFHPFLWRDGRMTDLGVLETGPREYGAATDVNERGQVVGFSVVNGNDEQSGSHAFLWQRGVLTDLGTLGGEDSIATGINDRGQVVGLANPPDDTLHGFLWENGVMTDLGTCVAEDVNNRGQVIGTGPAPGDQRNEACLWQRGRTSYLGDRGELDGRGIAINDAGWAVGIRVVPEWDHRATLWRSGRVIDLGRPGGSGGDTVAINDRGQIVGHGVASPTSHAYLWERGTAVDLTTRGVPESTVLSDLNNRGWLVGTLDQRPALLRPVTS